MERRTEEVLTMAAVSQRMAGLESKFDGLEEKLETNTRITLEMKEVMDGVRLGFKVLGALGLVVKWAGMVAAGLLALWGFITAITHGVPPK